MLTFLFDDLDIRQYCRQMGETSVNIHTLLNKTGKAHYMKFHWKLTCDVNCLWEEEAVKVGGSTHINATKDLYDSIAVDNYFKWKLLIRTIDPNHEDRIDFDPLDVTKKLPEDILPLQPLGCFVLHEHIDNFFADNEQQRFIKYTKILQENFL